MAIKTTRVFLVVGVIAIIFATACFFSSSPTDIKLMWETVPLQGEAGRKASSHRAQEAAHRVFSSTKLTGLTRQQVIAFLGDPQKSNDSIYNFPFYPASKETLVYRFDTGNYGWQFDIAFDEHGRVAKVTSRGIE